MSKWAVLSVVVEGTWIFIQATEEVDLEWIKSVFPKARLEGETIGKRFGIWSCKITGLQTWERAAAWRIYGYLGQAGWEPYAVSADNQYWRKPLTG